MNDYPEMTPPAQDIPESCLGCPMLEHVAVLYQDSLESNEAFILQRANESRERDQKSLSTFFDEAVSGTKRTAEEAYQITTEDLAKIACITDLMPDSQDMTVPEFLRIYRTDDNRLGDASIGKVHTMLRESFSEQESLVDSLPVSKAVDIAAKGVAEIKKLAEHNLLLSQEFIDDQIALTDTEQHYRTALEGSAEAIYSDQVKKLVDNCNTGVQKQTVGFREKKIALYCGSQAYKGKNQ